MIQYRPKSRTFPTNTLTYGQYEIKLKRARQVVKLSNKKKRNPKTLSAELWILNQNLSATSVEARISRSVTENEIESRVSFKFCFWSCLIYISLNFCRLWNGEYFKARRCYSVQRVRLPYSLQEAYSSKYVFILFIWLILLFPSCFLCGLVLVRLSFLGGYCNISLFWVGDWTLSLFCLVFWRVPVG